MPFIRYDPEDMATAGGQCSCGLGFPLINKIEGRGIESLITPAGQVISPSDLGQHLFVTLNYIDCFLKYQAEQNELDKVIFRFVPLRALDEEAKNHLYNNLKELMGNRVEVKLEFVDDIPVEPSGKQAIIKSRISRDILPL